MRKTPLHFFRISLACFTAALFTVKASAQVIISPSLPQQTLAGVSYLQSIDCAMIEIDVAAGRHLRAIAYDEATSATGSFVHLEDEVAGGVLIIPITAPGGPSYRPSIALADDGTNPGQDYDLLVLYQDMMPSLATFHVYRITGVGTGTLGSSLIYSTVMGPTVDGISPRIDMFTDPFNQINSRPALTRFMLSWVDVSNDLFAMQGDVTSLGAWSTFPVIATNVYSHDVAAATDINSGQEYAYFVTADFGSANWDLIELDVTNSTINSVTTVFASVDVLTTRIEAMSLFDPGAGLARYQAVASLPTNPPFHEVWGYNDLTGLSNLTNPLFPASNSYGPVVAAGSWNNGSPGIGNQQYTMTWWEDGGNGEVYAQASDLFGSLVSINYNQVSNNPIVNDVLDAVAVCNGDNTGDGMLTAWYDLNTQSIYYKRTGNTFGYKPTGSREIFTDGDFQMYPNPAIDRRFNITTKELETDGKLILSITNMIGQQVYEREYTTSGKDFSSSIDLSIEPAGIYFVEVQAGNKKWVKKLYLQ